MSKLALALSGGVGGVVAALCDVVQKNEASAVAAIARAVEVTLRMSFPPILAVILTVCLAIALCFVFEPDTKTKAFYLGASVLAIVMTVVPYKSPPDLQSSASGAIGRGASVNVEKPILFARATFLQEARATRASIVLVPEDGEDLPDILITLLARDTRRIVAQSKTTSRTFYFSQAPGEYLVRVEASRYQIVEDTLTLRPGEASTRRLELKRTWIPLPVQRLFRW